MAYFYFDFRDVDKQKLQNLLPSLLIQLSARSDPRCDTLSCLYSSHDRGVRKPNDRAMIECLKEMLTLDENCPTYIILDAIDECPLRSSVGSPREEVLDFINELVGLHRPNVRGRVIGLDGTSSDDAENAVHDAGDPVLHAHRHGRLDRWVLRRDHNDGAERAGGWAVCRSVSVGMSILAGAIRRYASGTRRAAGSYA